MRLCRFDEGRLGIVEGANVRDPTAALEVLASYRYPFPSHDILIANLPDFVTRARMLAEDAPVLASRRCRPGPFGPGKLG